MLDFFRNKNSQTEHIVPDHVSEILKKLQGSMTSMAVGAAKIAMRMGKLSNLASVLSSDTAEISKMSASVKEEIRAVTEISVQTADNTKEISLLAEKSLLQSETAARSANHMQSHMDITLKRILTLMEKIQAIAHVSKSVQDIATETKMLSLNAAVEAARAGEAGKGFTVVAEHIQKLAHTTASQTSEIFSILQSIDENLEPSRKAILESQALSAETSTQAKEIYSSFEKISNLVQKVAKNTGVIADSISQQRSAMDMISERIESTTESCVKIRDESSAISKDNFILSQLVEKSHEYFSVYDTGTVFHRVLTLARELALSTEKIFENAIEEGELSLDKILRLSYKEISGADIKKLSRLFNIAKVPSSGFTPPKFFTEYDQLVDLQMQSVMDEIKAREPRLVFSLVLDLNAYGPIHNKVFCKDWTGNPEQDLAGNRCKRFFLDNNILVRGARVGLSQRAQSLPNRSSREDFLAASPKEMRLASSEDFLVQTYARDTGAVMTVLTTPIFVRGHRYGATLMGWSE